MFLKDVTVTVTLNTLQCIFITNNVSDVTGFRRIFNPVGLKTADHRRPPPDKPQTTTGRGK